MGYLMLDGRPQPMKCLANQNMKADIMFAN